VPGPGRELFAALERALGRLPIVAEDLGEITPDVDELRRAFDLPGMKVLQFGFLPSSSDHLPHRLERARHREPARQRTRLDAGQVRRGEFECRRSLGAKSLGVLGLAGHADRDRTAENAGSGEHRQGDDPPASCQANGHAVPLMRVGPWVQGAARRGGGAPGASGPRAPTTHVGCGESGCRIRDEAEA